jgi:hypothetical protein
MKIRVRPRRNAQISGRLDQIARKLDKGQNTHLASDKVAFDQFRELTNLVHTGDDWELRGGQSILASIDDILSLGIYEKEGSTELVASIKTATDTSKVSIVNRTTGALTDIITGIASEEPSHFTSLRGCLYATNGETAPYYYDGSSSGTVTMPASTNAVLCANDGERVFVTTDTGQLLFSNITAGVITTFVLSGTNINRAGVCNSQIVNFTAIKGLGRSIVACANNRVERHNCPNFAKNGITAFPADMTTLEDTWENVGTESAYGLEVVGAEAYVKPNSEKLYKLVPGRPQTFPIQQEEGLMGRMTWDDVQMAYDPRWNLLLIAGKKDTDTNDTAIAYSISDKTFSEFTRIAPARFAVDKDNTYYMRAYDRKIVDCLKDDGTYTDFDNDIEWKVQTADTYGGSLDYWKVVVFLYVNFLLFEDIDVTLKFIAQQKVESTSAKELWRNTFSLIRGGSSFAGLPYFTMGVYGGAGFSFEEKFSEYYNSDIMVNEEFFRGSLALSGSSRAKFVLRGLGLYYRATNKKFRPTYFTD